MLKTLSSSVYWMGPVYLVIFCYWVGPVPYLELFGAGPVEKNTLYKYFALCNDNDDNDEATTMTMELDENLDMLAWGELSGKFFNN